MSTLVTATVKSNSSSPPAFQNSSGTQIGTLCRAWVNFNGTGTVAINAQFNVSSITDNGTGDYTVNFSNAMSDANFCADGTSSYASTPNSIGWDVQLGSQATGSVRMRTTNTINGGVADSENNSVAIFR